ncbi:uncharacterized protein LOC101451072 isoform X2 [Ceratitis capitata]|uniref:uncharacterized protein LOC101451072 isoform X2 n=1 Tax=Ceratitis capitata TaxID=7213 RepID=UPI0006188239|nr:uncharacterized protein LOC101451072 isoform X2 [Ceratitis capitata]
MSVSSAAILKSGEEMSNIFEEIEQLLKQNECLDPPSKSLSISTNKLHNISVKTDSRVDLPNVIIPNESQCRSSAPITRAHSEDVTLNFLPDCCDSEFLTATEAQTLPEDELSLYSVNQNELQPVNAPFMVPGIYKKIGNSQVSSSKTKNKSFALDATNVIVTTKTSNGKIVSRNQFEGHGVSDLSTENPSKNKDIGSALNESSKANVPSDKLLKFAYSIYKTAKRDRIIINREKNEVSRLCTNNNQQKVYRLLGPEEFNLISNNESVQLTPATQNKTRTVKPKVGRPPKRLLENCDNERQGKCSNNPKPMKGGKEDNIAELETNPHTLLVHTRSGRVVKPRSELSTISLNKPSVIDHVKDLINDSKDKDFRKNIQISSMSTEEIELSKPPLIPCPDTSKRRVPPESICPKCGKIFLGRRLKRHFVQHPDHMIANADNKSILEQTPHQAPTDPFDADMTLFRYLTLKLQKPSLNEDQRADLFLSELNDLVEQLQLRSSRLIRNTSGLHFICARASRVLGIPEEHGEELKQHHSIAPVVSVSTPSLDYTAISLDDTLTDEAAQKLNLSAGGKLLPPSEESLLRAVGDLVHDGITKLVDTNILHPPRTVVQSTGASTLVQHYDHVSDNAVEALSIKSSDAPEDGTPLLDLPVDFFKFKNN